MLIQRINRTDAEKIFLICQNGTGATVTTGMGARYLGALGAEVASTDGIQVTPMDAVAAMCQFAGIAAQDIASLGYGRVQAWGYCNSIMLSGTTTSLTVGVDARVGTFLQPGGVAGTWWSTWNPTIITGLVLSATAPLASFSKYVQNTVTTQFSNNAVYGAGGPYTSGFVRAM